MLRKHLGSSPSGPTKICYSYGRVEELADSAVSDTVAHACAFKSRLAHQKFNGLVAKLGMRLALNEVIREFDSHRDPQVSYHASEAEVVEAAAF